MMYLARVLEGKEPIVYVVDEVEFAVTRGANGFKMRSLDRVAHSWRIKSYGVHGGAAFSDSPTHAIAAAKVMAEFGLMERAALRTRVA